MEKRENNDDVLPLIKSPIKFLVANFVCAYIILLLLIYLFGLCIRLVKYVKFLIGNHLRNLKNTYTCDSKLDTQNTDCYKSFSEINTYSWKFSIPTQNASKLKTTNDQSSWAGNWKKCCKCKINH